MSRTSSAVRTLSLGICATLVAAVVAAPGASAAGKPLAQSVGRFLDGSVGGNPIQQLADVHDARAVNPGTTSAQNPLDVTLLGQLEVPLTNALKLPGAGVAELGAVNQVAVAKSDGYSYGASGAVSNSGGISLGGNDKKFPANAKITLSADSLGTVPIPTLPGLPGIPDTASLGGVSAEIGAVSALAQTKSGGDAVTPQYQVAGLTLSLGSPAIGALLNELGAGGDALQGVLKTITDTLNLSALLPSECTSALVNPSLTKIYLPTSGADKGAITIDPLTATITLDLAKLLDYLGLNLNDLPANTDLLGAILGQLPALLATALANVVDGLTKTLIQLGGDCVTALTGVPGLGALLQQLLGGEKTFVKALNDVADQLTKATAAPIAQLTGALAKVVAIGVNVESGPGKAADNKDFPFTSKLDATPDQATPVVANQTLVRAIEIDVLGGNAAVLALANAAAGPSTPAVAPTPTPTPTPTTTVPGTAIPTGVPAGLANTDNGSPTLPIVLLILGLLMAAGGAATWRLRGGTHTG